MNSSADRNVTVLASIKTQAIVFMLLWTVVVAGSLAWNIFEARQYVLVQAKTAASAALNKDLAYRRWAAGHGGVYVPITETTPPNPYLLHIDERDIETNSGRRLTLVNPAYMTRQVFETGQAQYGVRGHITSLTPIRKKNEPDPWEKQALESFEHETKDVGSVAEMNGESFFRFMRPLITEKGCLTCHGAQGYAEGSIRGGISVSVPLNPYFLALPSHLFPLIIGHAFFWLLGLTGLLFARGRLLRHEHARAEAEKAVRVREQFLHDIYEAADNVSMITTDLGGIETRIIDFSPGAEKIFGYAREEIIGKHVALLHPPQFVKKIAAMQETLHKNKKGFAGETTLIRKGGASFAGLFTLHPRFNPAGKLVGTVGVTIDISVRKQVEESLRQSEERFRALHNASFGGIVIHDQGIILDCNQGLSDITGYSMDELIGMDGKNLLAPDWHELVMNNVRSGFDQAYEAEGLRKDGTKYSLRLRGKQIPYKGRTARVAEFRDITEHKQADEEKVKLEEQLYQSQKMESVGQLAGGVAHDFNNMLGVISGFSDLAMDQVDSTAPIFENLKQIQSAADRSADITRQLLAFARKQAVVPRVLDLNETVEGMLKMLRRLIGEDIELVWRPEDGLWSVRMDPSQIDQILVNLLVNARDSITGAGKIEIKIDNITLKDEYFTDGASYTTGGFVRITVTDNGCGMNKVTRERMFEPFFTTKSLGAGTGLGLATVYGIIRQNNGFIRADSEPGQGTTFTIYLPQYLGGTKQARTKCIAELRAPGNENILLVEDESAVLNMVTKMLEHLGYAVVAANSPSEAIKLLREFDGEIHLLLTDMIMPEMNGRELIEHLLAIQPELKCLVMSGYTADIIAKPNDPDEEVYLIQKPFRKNELSAKIREVLES